MIGKATLNDFDEVEKNYNKVILYQRQHNAYTIWRSGAYPIRKTAKTALSGGSLYDMENSGKICASIIIDNNAPKEYESINWKFPANPFEVLIIHLLCLRPSKAGRRIGKEMVNFTIKEAKRLGCKVVGGGYGKAEYPSQSVK